MSQEIPHKIYLLALENIKKKNFQIAKDYLIKFLKYKQDHNTLNLLGICYLNLNEYFEAAKIFKSFVDQGFISDIIFNNLGIALKNLHQHNDALHYFNCSIKLNDKNHKSYYNCANLFLDLGKEEKSEEFFKKSLKINQEFLPSLINLSKLYLYQFKPDKCLDLLKKKSISSVNKVLLENIVKAYLVKKDLKNAKKYLLKLIKLFPQLVHKTLPLAIGYSYEGNNKGYKLISELYTKNVTNKSSIYSFNINKKTSPIISFLSSDIRTHPIGFFAKDMLSHLSKKFKIVIFNTSNYEDEISLAVKKHSEWITLPNENDEYIAEKIYNRKVDVLFDTSGMSKTNKLGVFKLKPCRMQVSWAGWLASSHLKEIDFIISDRYCTKLTDERFFIEKIYRLERIWCSYSLYILESFNLRKVINNESKIVFGCFQRAEKINKEVMETWAKILLNVKNSKIIFVNKSFNNYEQKILLSHFEKEGISSKRLLFKKPKDRRDYLNSYNLVDINLDTFPYNGGTTLFEASFMGVPTITMINNSFMFRCGESINKNLNMKNWIAKNKNDYIKKVEDFSDKKLLIATKKKLIRESCKTNLFNSKLFAEDFSKMIMNIL